MLQLLYISSARRNEVIDLDQLLAQAQRNNARDEITGLLYTDGRRFLQALEGPKTAVEDVFLRIIADPRHHALVLLSRRETTRREFGEWSMARRSFQETQDQFGGRIAALCRDADPSIRGTFAGLVDVRDAA
ncbi:BLUF domain-containing protein [Sphingomonas sp. HITSZ_GF]|uniref:BLUF domain-containing protein n=1 Tax=Sphingomonas sp. HITSZ_GF TaxID=3037247 RepID=UPI00240DCC5E|nr:BLUF domain-containing protein [Sphingomonas sp. HITSZ_GF]MDG2535197.1 BLUF domain-containing protein [Sphingomonas sp. HITSZ_GF]